MAAAADPAEDPAERWRHHKGPAGPGCCARCSRASWADWDDWHESWHLSEREHDHGSMPPQYQMSDVELAIFRYVFADTFNGELSIQEKFGILVAIGSVSINLISITVAFGGRFILNDAEPREYPFFVDLVIAFEFGYFFANAVWNFWQLRGKGYRYTESGRRCRNQFAQYRYLARRCAQLGELNAFTLLRLLKPYALREKLNQGRKLSMHARGVCVPVIMVVWVLGTGCAMAFSVIAILAKLSLMEFIFKRSPLIFGGLHGWGPGHWLAAIGFLNNLIRRDLSETARVKVLEYAVVGHYVAVDGTQAELVEQLVCDFYEAAMGQIVDRLPAGKLSWTLRLELFAFFTNLSASDLFRFHEMAYGLGSATVEARSLLSRLLHLDAPEEPETPQSTDTKTSSSIDSTATAAAKAQRRLHAPAWEHVAEESIEGERIEVPSGLSTELVECARYIAGMLDPAICRPIEGLDESVSGRRVKKIIGFVEKYISCTTNFVQVNSERERVLNKERRRSLDLQPDLMKKVSRCSTDVAGSVPVGRKRSMSVFGQLLIPPLPVGAPREDLTCRRPRGGPSANLVRTPTPVREGTLLIRTVRCAGLVGQPFLCGPCQSVDCDAFVEVSVPNLDADWPRIAGRSKGEQPTWSEVVGRTHIAPSGDLNPAFGQCYAFPFKARPCTVVVEVMDFDVGSLPDSLGFANLPVTAAMIRVGGWTLHELDLQETPEAGEGEDSNEPAGGAAVAAPVQGKVVLEVGLPEIPAKEGCAAAEPSPARVRFQEAVQCERQLSELWQDGPSPAPAPPPTAVSAATDPDGGGSTASADIHELRTGSSSSEPAPGALAALHRDLEGSPSRGDQRPPRLPRPPDPSPASSSSGARYSSAEDLMSCASPTGLTPHTGRPFRPSPEPGPAPAPDAAGSSTFAATSNEPFSGATSIASGQASD
eukprot:TRINITY_DN23642_c0_g1_i1.p1 TRINITY_DN23642_c0_g1~~TRINITY_DN23642_c0_g1_i1.p1  ORF type:complete len:966 (+),score=267.65 TRINITY_DN23642_c0_g1_i1:97-2898(+)